MLRYTNQLDTLVGTLSGFVMRFKDNTNMKKAFQGSTCYTDLMFKWMDDDIHTQN